jgi:viologen exporter family transport system permease protein
VSANAALRVSPLGRYAALASGAIQERLAYRNAFFLSVLSHLLGCIALIYLWRSVYGNRPSLNGFTWPQLQTYLLLTFLTNSVAGWQAEITMVNRIANGTIGIDLLKPFDFQLARLVETLGCAAFEATVLLLVLALVALCLGGILLPADLTTFVLACVSFGLGLLIKFGIQFLTCLLAFWSNHGWGIVQGRVALTQLFSGALVPLPFMPDGLRGVAEFLPFQGIVYLPSSIYLGQAGERALGLLASQAAWALGLLFLGRLSFAGALRKVTIHGG